MTFHAKEHTPTLLTPQELLLSQLPGLLSIWKHDRGRDDYRTAQDLVAAWSGLQRLVLSDRPNEILRRVDEVVRVEADSFLDAIISHNFDCESWLRDMEKLDADWDSGHEEAEELEWRTREAFNALDRTDLLAWFAATRGPLEARVRAWLDLLAGRRDGAERFIADRPDLFLCLATDLAAVIASSSPGLEESDPLLWETLGKHRRVEEARDEVELTPSRHTILASVRNGARKLPVEVMGKNCSKAVIATGMAMTIPTIASAVPSTIDIVERFLATDPGLTLCYDPPAEPATDGLFGSLPPSLHPELSDYIACRYPRGLFRHQSAATQRLLAGRHTVVATRTSSGKSLIYLIPVFDRLLTESASTALFLFPQKALANDQLKKFTTAADELPSLARQRAVNPHLIARYDGATPADLKSGIRAGVQVLLTNPDMLHYAVLAWHEKHWERFLSRLRYVVVDECHEYRGIFGTNVSYLFRRLRALCSRYGSSPTFIATSATVQSPQEHMERLTGLQFECVGPVEDGSSRGMRKFWMVRPEEHPHDAGREITLALAEAGLTVLTFSPSRTAAERMIARSGRDNKDSEPPFVRVYRAGLTSSEREEIESGLRDRTVRAVFSTNALELGIDIGAIDVVVCVGLPTTMMSLWQRAGRAGRAGKQGAVILIPGQTPIDAYYSAHPDRLFARDHEPLVLNLSNQRVLHQHYACAAKEAGDEARLDTATLGPEISAVKVQRDAGLLREEVFYVTDPHRSVRIRGIGDEAYKLVCDGVEIGEIDPFHLLREAPRNGIYSHGGIRYRVKDVLEKQRQVRLAREFSPHFTTSTVRTSIRVGRLPILSQHGRVVVARATLDVNDYLLGVTEKHLSGEVVRNYAGAGMPNNWLPTEGTMLRLERPLWADMVARLGEPSAKAALETTARLFGSLFPTVTGPCDASDYSATADVPKDGPPAVYLYDMVPYGVGLAVEAFDRMANLVERAAEQVHGCSCGTDEGCFQCVRNPQAEVPASKAATLAFLTMIGVELAIAPVTLRAASNGAPPALENCPMCQSPRQAAARFCSNCGARLEATS